MKTNIPKTITNLWSCYTTSKKNNSSVSNCSVREGFIDLIKNTSKIFLILVYSEFPRAFRPSLYFVFLVYSSCTPRIFRMIVWWAKANYSTTTVFINEKFAKTFSKSSLYLQIRNVNSTLLGTLETLDHSSRLKIILNTTAALFTKVIVRVVKTVGESVRNVALRWA